MEEKLVKVIKTVQQRREYSKQACIYLTHCRIKFWTEHWKKISFKISNRSKFSPDSVRKYTGATKFVNTMVSFEKCLVLFVNSWKLSGNTRNLMNFKISEQTNFPNRSQGIRDFRRTLYVYVTLTVINLKHDFPSKICASFVAIAMTRWT